jgi:SAM-dependent methyltransferase
MTEVNREDPIHDFIDESYAAGDPTGWFDRLYAAAEDGAATVPWDRGSPHRLLAPWAESRGLDGDGKRAVVVGCGFGDDAEYIASLAYDTVAFDIAPAAIRAAQRRFPDTRVRYVAANLLNPPDDWRESFDLVVECQTVQSLPQPLHPESIANVGNFVAPGGTLIVLAAAGKDDDVPHDDPPWPLTPSEIDRFAAAGLEAVDIAVIADADQPDVRRWCAEFRRPPEPAT